jgi:adenylosuccinate synthase
VTKLDVLGAYTRIPFGVAYEIDGQRTTDMPPTGVLERATPIYEECAGWCVPLDGVRDRDHLPAAAQLYLKKIEATVGAPVGMVGIGPERAATLL